jgi:hypothetical protein
VSSSEIEKEGPHEGATIAGALKGRDENQGGCCGQTLRTGLPQWTSPSHQFCLGPVLINAQIAAQHSSKNAPCDIIDQGTGGFPIDGVVL